MNSLELSEQRAAAVAKTDKRITYTDICDVIVKESYYYDDTLTICVLTVRNGFKVIGESACVDPANYNKALGDDYARQDAMRKLWPLEAYLLSAK